MSNLKKKLEVFVYIIVCICMLSITDWKALWNMLPTFRFIQKQDDFHESLKKIRNVFKSKAGSSRDVYILKEASGDNDEVMVIFGFLNDMEVCQGIVEGMHRTPEVFGINVKERYRCVYAN